MKHTAPDVDVPLIVDVTRTMLSTVTTRDDELDKLPINVLALTSEPADTRSLLPADIMLVSFDLPGTPRDRTTFGGTAIYTNN